MTPVLEMQGVGVTYGAVRALSDVDLHVNAGEVLALVGDNGAGKSTLVKGPGTRTREPSRWPAKP